MEAEKVRLQEKADREQQDRENQERWEKALLGAQAECEERVHKEELARQDAQVERKARCQECNQDRAKG